MTMTNQAKVMTKGKLFTSANLIGERAVRFVIAGKGECVVGFARDRNAFMEHYNGVVKEVTRLEVLKRLDRYQGADVVKLISMVKSLKPVTMNAGHCSHCGCELARGVYNYSLRNFGQALCREHQRGLDRQPARQQDKSLPNVIEEDTHCDEWTGRDMDFVNAYDDGHDDATQESEFNVDLCFDCQEKPDVDGFLCQECLDIEKAKHVPQSEPKPKRQRRAAGVGKDKESQTQRGGRKPSAGGKGTSAKSDAKGA